MDDDLECAMGIPADDLVCVLTIVLSSNENDKAGATPAVLLLLFWMLNVGDMGMGGKDVFAAEGAPPIYLGQVAYLEAVVCATDVGVIVASSI